MDNALYAPPKAVIANPRVTPKDVEAFVQFGPYVEQFNGRLAGETRRFKFNIFAALFGFYWAFFRRLNKVGIALFLGEIFIFIGTLLLIRNLNLSTEIIGYNYTLAGSIPCWILIRLPFAFCANDLYFRHSLSTITSIKDKVSGSDAEVEAAISEAGGVKLYVLAIGIVNYLLVAAAL
jgi:hypothetical protein